MKLLILSDEEYEQLHCSALNTPQEVVQALIDAVETVFSEHPASRNEELLTTVRASLLLCLD